MEEDDDTCPLCLEQLDITDKHIDFCQCGYRMCLWCWHHIMENALKDNLPGRCPNCRKEYDKERITKGQVDPLKLAEEQEKKRKKDSKVKSKSGEGFSRKHLQSVRVIQRNLVYAIGVPLRYCKEELLKRNEFFGKYGKILKISVNRNGAYSSSSNGAPTGSAYVTFMKEDDAVECIKKVDGTILDGNPIRACFGTTKYCNSFLKYQTCNNPDCLYLHEIGEHTDSFTKEQMVSKLGTKNQNFHELTHPPGKGPPLPAFQASFESSFDGKQGVHVDNTVPPLVSDIMPQFVGSGPNYHNFEQARQARPPNSQHTQNHFISPPNSFMSNIYPRTRVMGPATFNNEAGGPHLGQNMAQQAESFPIQNQFQGRFLQPDPNIQQNLFGQQPQESLVPTSTNGEQPANQYRPVNHPVDTDGALSLGAGLGGLFGASGGGYNFDFSSGVNGLDWLNNGSGFHSQSNGQPGSVPVMRAMPKLHQTVSDIESRLLGLEQLDGVSGNTGNTRTTSRFSFANNSENAQINETAPIHIPPGFSA